MGRPFALKHSLRDLVPELIERRVKALVQTDDAVEAVSRLCAAGYGELASTILTYVVSGECQSSTYMPFSPSDRLVSCSVHMSDETGITYVTMYIDREGSGDIDATCIAIEDTMDIYITRPCTYKETSIFAKPLEEARAVKKREKEAIKI